MTVSSSKGIGINRVQMGFPTQELCRKTVLCADIGAQAASARSTLHCPPARVAYRVRSPPRLAQITCSPHSNGFRRCAHPGRQGLLSIMAPGQETLARSRA
eukprot:201518-Pyramimonas_sp.AAC.1